MTAPLSGSADYTSDHDRRTADRLATIVDTDRSSRGIARTALDAGYGDEHAVAASDVEARLRVLRAVRADLSSVDDELAALDPSAPVWPSALTDAAADLAYDAGRLARLSDGAR